MWTIFSHSSYKAKIKTYIKSTCYRLSLSLFICFNSLDSSVVSSASDDTALPVKQHICQQTQHKSLQVTYTSTCQLPEQSPVSHLNNHLPVTCTSTCQSPVQAPVSHLHRVHASHLNKHLPITWTRRPMRTHARWPAVPCTSQPPSSQNRTTEWTTEVSLDGHLTRYEMRWKTVPAKDAFSCTSKVNNHCVAN